MKILVDENIMKKISELFKDFGHDVISINNIKKGITDNEVLEIAIKQQRVLVTMDKKFFKKFKSIQHYGVIFIATDPKYQYESLKLLLPKLNRHIPLDNKNVKLTKDDYYIEEKRKSYLPFASKKISLT